MYSLYSEFDIQKHKETFVNYLEVVIKNDGKIEYAVPSHAEKLARIACEKYGVSRKELDDMCPPEEYGNYLAWLCRMSGAIAIWDCGCSEVSDITQEQVVALRKLKMSGLYHGKIPKFSAAIRK